MKSKIIWLVSGLMILMLLMPVSFVSAAPQGKCVYVCNSTDFYMSGLDWFTGRGYVSNTIKCMFSDSLVNKKIDGTLEPGLAKSWEAMNGNQSYKFTLVKNAKFHDGTPVTAEDVKFSLERYKDPELKWAFGKEWQKAYKDTVIDGDTITVNFNEPYPALFDRCTEYLGIAPKSYIEKVGDDGFKDKPIGCGPFKLVKFDYNVSIDVTAVPDHYRKPPDIKDLTLMFVVEDPTRMAMLKAGEADVIRLTGPQIPEAKKDKNIRIGITDYCNLEAVCFYEFMNGTKGPWQDIRVRQAVDYAIDRKMIAEKVMNGSVRPYKGILAPYNPGYDPAVEKPTEYNPEKAKALLKEAGYPNGFTVNFYTLSSRKPQSEAIAGYLSMVGINCKMNVMENAPLVKKQWARELDGIGVGTGVWWVGRVHPGVALKSFMTNDSRYGYCASPEITAAVHKTLSAVGDKAVAEAAREITPIYLKQFTQVTLWSTTYINAIGPTVDKAPAVSGWPFPSGFEHYKMK